MRIIRSIWKLLNNSEKITGITMTTTADEKLYNKIDTFVFFDLETTDLIKGNKMPKITELSMVATSRYSIRCDKRDRLALPRILHKLTIPICPKQQINPQASYVSNLWNDTLDNCKPFDESTYNMIMQFLDRLPGLICFVAHNGNRFDYPIILSELDQIKKTFPDRILCVDSYLAFKEFYSDVEPANQPTAPVYPAGIDEVDEEELLSLKNEKSNSSLDDHWNDALCNALDEIEKVETRQITSSRFNYNVGKDVLDALSGSNTPHTSPKSMQAKNEKTPENQMIRSTSAILNGARKQLLFSNSKPKNFKLSTVYMHMIGREAENVHCAEGDCISLLRCICQIGPHFADWADFNAVSLNLFKTGAN